MALTQDQFDAMFGGSIKRIATMEDLAEEEEKRRQEQAQADAQKAAQEEAAKKEEEDKKNILQKAGDVIGGVGNAVKNIAVGGADFLQETVKSGKNLLEIGNKHAKESKFQEGESAINKKYNKEANEKVWKGYENAQSFDELPEDRQKAWEDIQSRRRAEMDDYKSKTERGYSEKTRKLFEEQAVREKDFKKAGQQFYEGAQYIPGVSLGVEGAGTVGALIQGDDGDINKSLIELTQKKDWDKLSDEEKKAALAQRNISGALSTLDVLPGAGKVVGTGAKVAFKQGIKAGAKEAAEAYGKSVAKKTVKELTEVGAKELVKQTVKSTAVGTGTGAALGAGIAVAQGGDVEDAAWEGARRGAAGGFIGSPFDLDVKSATKGEFDAKATPKGLEDIDATAGKVVDELDAAKAADEAQLKLNKERPFNKIDDAELDAQIEAFGRNENRTDDIIGDYKRQQQLLDEKAARQMEADRVAFTENGLPNDVAGAQKALDDFNNGDLPDTALRPREANIESTAQIFADESIPIEIRNAAQEVMDDLAQAENVQKTLMNDVKYERAHIDMDNAYRERLAQIQEMPEPRYIQERQKLDTQYQDDLAELEMIREKDLPEVQQYNEIIDRLKQREQRIVSDVNTLIKERPDDFRIPDEAEVAARRTELESNLESAKRFNEPAKQVEEISERADPVAAVNRDAEAQASFKQEASTQVDEMAETVKSKFKNIVGAKLGMLRVMSPSQVLKMWGLRGKDIDLHTDILRAESALNRANKADSEVLSEIARIIPENKVAQSQIIDYLEGNRKTLDLGDQQAADKIRAFLDEKKAGLEAQGYGTIEEYFPHIFNKKDPDVQRLFKAKNNGEISFGNLKARLENSDDYSRDLMAVLTQYASGYNRKTILEPALKPLADLHTQVRLAEAEAKWLDGYIDQLMGFDKSNLGQSYNAFMDGVLDKVGLKSQVGKNHYSSHLGGQRMVSAVATMGLNAGTAIRNVTQMINTVADIGPRYSTIGTIDGLRALRAGPNSAEWAELQRVGIMEGGVAQNYFDAITNPGVRGRLSKGRDNAVKGMMSMIHGTDVMLRAQAYYGAKALAIKKGLTGKAAEDFAARKVVDTQFITSRVDMPLAFNGQGVRSLTQLATFSGKQAGFLKREIGDVFVKGKDGRYTIDPKHAGNILAAVGAAWATTELLKPVMGFRETEFIPFYDQIAPMFAAITGEEVEGGDSLYRSPLVRLLAGDGKSKMGLIQAIQSGDLQGFWDDNWSQIIPAGTQIKKTTEGLETTLSGESRNSSGKIRYLQDMDPSSVGQATIFGQYSTKAGREWIKNGFPTLSDEQTQKVDLAADRKSKEQLTDFYQASKNIDFKNSEGKKGLTNATDDIKNAILQGNLNKAQRIANEYNEAVSKAMQNYYSKQDEMPQELQDILYNRMYISVQKVMENMDDY